MHNINPYIQSDFETEFIGTDIYNQLVTDWDILSFDKFYRSNYQISHRQAEAFGNYKNLKSKFSTVPFYYLDYLTKQNPAQIYDIGCGWNIFKRYIPNVTGVGAEDPDSGLFFGDIHDFVDQEFIGGHQNFFESMFSINALHFVPLSDMATRIWNFYTMLKPGGHGFLTFNFMQLLERDCQRFQGWSNHELENYVRKTVHGLTIKYLVVDIDLTSAAVRLDEGMDGNIRLVMERK